MKPRYPTNVRFRRHTNRPRLLLMALGLASVVVGFVVNGLFSHPAQGEGEGHVSTPAQEIPDTAKKEALPLPVAKPLVAKVPAVEKPTAPVEKPTPNGHAPQTVTPEPASARNPSVPPGSAKVEEVPVEEAPVEVALEDLPKEEKNPEVNLTFFESLRQKQMVVPQAMPETTKFKFPVEPLDSPVDSKNNPQTDKAKKPPTSPVVGQALPLGAYIIQVASFPSEEAASKLAGDLMRAGHPATIQSGQANGRTVFRVRVGPFSNPGQAQSTLAALGPKAAGAMLLRN